MIPKIKAILIVLLMGFLIACNTLTPAGFWKDYRKSDLLKNICDQGPYGGHLSMFWQTTNKHVFNSSYLIAFATKNGWELYDSLSMSADTLKSFFLGRSTFPFTYTDFNDTTKNVSIFPRWISSDIILYRFKTGWIAIEPGNARQTEYNGYIVLSSDRTQLSVYHLWGE